MKHPILPLLIVAVLALSLGGPLWARSRSQFENGYLSFFDDVNFERVRVMAPIFWEDDFVGYKLNKYTTGENTSAPWLTVETNLNTAIGLVADAHQASLELDADDNAERAVLYFGDQEAFSAFAGCALEARVQVSVLPTTNAEIVIGLAGADNATADTIDIGMWFRLLDTDSDALLWETDDNVTNDDDNAAQAVAVSTWYVLRIECLPGDTSAKFFVDNVLVGTGAISGLDATTGRVQPYIAVQKASGVGVGTLLVDYVRVWGGR